MDLTTFRKKNKWTMKRCSEEFGVTPQHLYEIERGDSWPSRELAIRIEKATHGEVTAKELLIPSTIF